MKRFLCLFLVFILSVSLVGCSDDQLQSVVFEWDSPAKNVDPLLASSQNELTVTKNIFEPLLICAEDGSINYGAAKEYSVDSSELVYNFTLRDGLKWSDETPLSANDFVFALKRAVDPATKSSCYQSLSAIKNAAEIHSGKLGVDSLGVTANGNVLTITLSQKDNNFLRTMTGTAGMPCNEAFFYSSGGKYGMTKDTTISNGPFYVSSWNTDQGYEAVRISKNKHYKGSKTSSVQRVTFKVEKPADRISRIKRSEIEGGIIDNTDLSTVNIEGLTALKYSQTVSTLVFNTDSSIMSNATLRKALVCAGNFSLITPQLPEYITAYSSIVSSSYLDSEGFYIGKKFDLRNIEGDAKKLFDTAIKTLDKDKLSDLTLYHPDDATSKLYASYIVQNWQKQLGLYVSLTAVSQSELKSRLTDGSYTFAIAPFSSFNNMATDVLSLFSTSSAYRSLTISPQYDTLVSKGDRSSLVLAEHTIYSECRAVPLFETYNAYCVGKKVTSAVLFPGSSIIDFSQLK